MKRKIIPYQHFTLTTALTIQEAAEKLTSVIGKPRPVKITFKGMLDPPKNAFPYQGSFNGKSFSVLRNLAYRNSFQPRITGTLESVPGGTRITMKMMPEIFIIVFISIWMLGVFVAFSAILIFSFIRMQFEWAVIFPVLMFFAGFAMLYFGFNLEAEKTRKDFEELLRPPLDSIENTRI